MNLDISGIIAASLNKEALLEKLKSRETGLNQTEVNDRRTEFGQNTLIEEQQIHPFLDFLLNFRNPLVLILLIASGILFYLGEHLDSLIIFTIVLMSVSLNYFQERQASISAKKLKDSIHTTTTCLRDGNEIEIKVENVCVGDVLVLEAGDLIPADARVIFAKDFFVNQSSLTGESFPAEKNVNPVRADNISLVDLTNIIYAGSNVETGSARAVVFAIGKRTEFGKIAHDLNKHEETEFTRGTARFSFTILKLTMFVVMTVFLLNALLKDSVIESFLFAVAVAVGLTPELLPMILSITMAKGSSRMAEGGVIVKKLNAIPNFGSMDVLCTDKTGTLTQDKIELVKYVNVYGNDSQAVLKNVYLNSYYHTGIRNPMDDAVLNFKNIEVNGINKVDEVPFDFVRKRMSVVVKDQDQDILITKGAPEEIFKVCKTFDNDNAEAELNEQSLKHVEKIYQELSGQGYRVLALAVKYFSETKAVYSKNDENEMKLTGFVAFFDPAKPGVAAVLSDINKMGVEIKVITGDNELVTQKICKDVGLNVKGVLFGYQIDALTDDALRVVVEKTTIFARFSPDEKNRIITALKQNNHVVGYMGDGINDAPSIKNADVGISVNNAVDVAKESAAIILTHKSLKELLGGIREGRKTFANTMKYIMMGISSNFGNMFSVIGAVVMLPYLPMLPIQILLNNMLYDVSQVTIPNDDVDEEYIKTPKRWNLGFIKKFMYIFGPVSSIFDFLTFTILYFVLHVNAAVFQTSWFLQSLATQTFVIYIIRTKKIPFLQSSPNKFVLLSTLVCVGIGWLLPFTVIGKFFGFAPPEPMILILISAIVMAYLVTVELLKRYFYHKFNF